jgi:hypothetical protein
MAWSSHVRTTSASLQLADRDGVRIPDVVVEARWLTPWSAEFRYDDPPVPDELDRNASLRSVEQALAWARGVLADSGS